MPTTTNVTPAPLALQPRNAWVSLPFIGTAFARQDGAGHYGLDVDRKAGSATLWAGSWEFNADGRQGLGIVLAFPLLMTVALMKAYVWPMSRSAF